QPADCLTLHRGTDRWRRDEGRRQRLVLQLHAPAKRDAAALVIDPDGVTPLGRGVDRHRPELVLLRREPQRVLERLLDQHRLGGTLEAPNALGAFEQLLRVELEGVEVRPPLRLLFTAVVLEELRKQPTRLALLRAREQLGFHPRALLEL